MVVPRRGLAALLGLAATGPLAARAAVKIEAMRHDIQPILASNFDGVISKFRDSSVSSLWFYHDDSKQDEAFMDQYNQVAMELKGMAKICAISCTDHPVFCKQTGVTETPAVMVYPPNPMPAFKYEGKMEPKALAAKIMRNLPDYTVRVTKDNVDGFVTKEPSKPKVMLFSSKKTVPSIWKALSSETVFKRTTKFGFIAEEDTEVVAKFGVKKFPTIIMQRGAKAEVKETYKGEMKFLDLKAWVNLHSESGVGDAVHGGGAGAQEMSIEEERPWLVQDVPELTAKSNQDVCFKNDGLCVIYLREGAITQPETEMLTGLMRKYTSQLSDRGAKLKWMWMDLAVEAEYKTLFDPSDLPSVVVFNPHKRLRFTKLEHDEESGVRGDANGVGNLVDKVLGGDARFKVVPGQKLPPWAMRKAEKKEL